MESWMAKLWPSIDRNRQKMCGFTCNENGWEAYFADMFDSITKGKLDELKKEHQGANSVKTHE